MIGYLVIGILAVGMFGVLASSVSGGLATFGDAFSRIETAARVEAAVEALRLDILQNGGPSGTIVAGVNDPELGYILPRNLGVPTTNPFGREFRYCPFGVVAAGSGHEVSDPGGVNYQVAVSGSRVVGGRPPLPRVSAEPRLVGYVTGTFSRIGNSPPCASVVYDSDTGSFGTTRKDGIVRPVFGGVDRMKEMADISDTMVIHVSPLGPDSASGRSPTEAMSLGRALTTAMGREARAVTIYLAPGTYSLGSSALDAGGLSAGTYRPGGRLMLVSGGGAAVINVPSGTLWRPAYDLFLKDVSVPNATVMVYEGRRLEMSASTVGRLLVLGGEAYLMASHVAGLAGTTSSLFVSGGYVGMLNAGSLNNSVRYPNNVAGSYAVWVTDGGFLDLPTAGLLHVGDSDPAAGGNQIANGIRVDFGSRLNLGHASRIVLDSVMARGVHLVGGRATLQTGTIRATVPVTDFVHMEAGAVWHMQNSNIGSPGGPNATRYGFFDSGAREVSGFGNIYAGSGGLCWESAWNVVGSVGRRPPDIASDVGDYGGLFAESPPGIPGNRSRPRDNLVIGTDVPDLPASPTAADLRPYAHLLQVNARRTALRLMNLSNFLCQ